MGGYVVFDLEMCKVKGVKKTDGKKLGMEIIQIGAVMLNEEYEIISSFNSYVRPAYGNIDTTINRLTGIEYKHISKAPALKEVLCSFDKWIGERDIEFVTWSDSDEKQLRKEMQLKNIINEKIEKLLESVIDCQKIFGEIIKIDRPYKLEEALILADIDKNGRAHDGYFDAENTALLFAKMMREPEFCFNSLYLSAREDKVEHIGTSMADIFMKLGVNFV